MDAAQRPAARAATIRAMESLPPPHDALRRAEQSLAAMRAATTFTEFSGHWQQLLQSVRRCWSKAETHYLRHAGWPPLQKKMMRRIFDNPVAGYLWHAKAAPGNGLPREATQPFDPLAVAAAEVKHLANVYRPPLTSAQVAMSLVQVAESGLAFYQALLAEIDAELK
jgi:hypothetical protein